MNAVKTIEGKYFPLLDLLILQENLKHGEEDIIQLLLQRPGEPNFYSIELDETIEEYSRLEDLDLRLRAALTQDYKHLCVQAHYLLLLGEGEVNITLFLSDD